MAAAANQTLKTIFKTRSFVSFLGSKTRLLSTSSSSVLPNPDPDSGIPPFTAQNDEFKKENGKETDDSIYMKAPKSKESSSSSSSSSSGSVTMPMSFMTGSIVGRRFYKAATTREADDGNGWTVMLDYRTLKTPSKRPLKLPTLALAKAIAAEWEFQVCSFIRKLLSVGSDCG